MIVDIFDTRSRSQVGLSAPVSRRQSASIIERGAHIAALIRA